MKTVAIAFLTVIVCGAIAAQPRFGDVNWLKRWFEGRLSTAASDVTIHEFRGALMATARIDTVTLSDREGVWLLAEDIVIR